MWIKGRVWFVAAGLSLFATGCASILEGSHQLLSLDARYRDTQVLGATCTLTNDKGKWLVTTPGSVTVSRSARELSARCDKQGLAPGIGAVKSAMKALNVVYMLVGGIAGSIIDSATGAAYHYPASMTVQMGDVGASDRKK